MLSQYLNEQTMRVICYVILDMDVYTHGPLCKVTYSNLFLYQRPHMLYQLQKLVANIIGYIDMSSFFVFYY